MNRLVIIGNGFDVAHGMETKYSHFINWYINECVNTFLKDGSYYDKLISFTSSSSFANFNIIKDSEKYGIERLNELNEWVVNNTPYKLISKISPFLDESIKKLKDLKWVDLESEYFKQLLKYRNTNKTFDFYRINILNEQLKELTENLHAYLLKIQNQNSNILLREYYNLFSEQINSDEFFSEIVGLAELEKVFFLNFNYTDTIERYSRRMTDLVEKPPIYIHGKLNDDSNPIIFGFGDEENKDFLDFKDLEEKSQILKNIKSFSYSLNNNYHDLMSILDTKQFQVCVFGHSLGLSDRTLLKEIFENKHCISIKMYYYQDGNENDFLDKQYNLFSHFKSSAEMRRKIVDFKKCSAMSQKPKQ